MRFKLLFAFVAGVASMPAQSPTDRAPGLPPRSFADVRILGAPSGSGPGLHVVKPPVQLSSRCSIPLREMTIAPGLNYFIRKQPVLPDQLTHMPKAAIPAPRCK